MSEVPQTEEKIPIDPSEAVALLCYEDYLVRPFVIKQPTEMGEIQARRDRIWQSWAEKFPPDIKETILLLREALKKAELEVYFFSIENPRVLPLLLSFFSAVKDRCAQRLLTDIMLARASTSLRWNYVDVVEEQVTAMLDELGVEGEEEIAALTFQKVVEKILEGSLKLTLQTTQLKKE